MKEGRRAAVTQLFNASAYILFVTKIGKSAFFSQRMTNSSLVSGPRFYSWLNSEKPHLLVKHLIWIGSSGTAKVNRLQIYAVTLIACRLCTVDR